MALVYRTGRVFAIEARPVYADDVFDYEFGLRPKLYHKRATGANRGALVHAYAIARFGGQNTCFEVITRHEAEQARKDSPGANKATSLWKTRPAAMWTKTAIKKLANNLPRDAVEGPAPAPAASYEQLINAVSKSPHLYRTALDALGFGFPKDPAAVDTVLSTMRDLYRSEQATANATAPEQQKTAPEAA
jgi:recombinational DNA repair protein RecT